MNLAASCYFNADFYAIKSPSFLKERRRTYRDPGIEVKAPISSNKLLYRITSSYVRGLVRTSEKKTQVVLRKATEKGTGTEHYLAVQPIKEASRTF